MRIIIRIHVRYVRHLFRFVHIHFAWPSRQPDADAWRGQRIPFYLHARNAPDPAGTLFLLNCERRFVHSTSRLGLGANAARDDTLGLGQAKIAVAKIVCYEKQARPAR